MIEVSSAEDWHAIILYLVTVTSWQYPPRLGMLFYIFARLGARGCSIGQRGKFAKKFFPRFRKNNVVYAAPTDIWIDFTSMISHVKSYALKYMISGNFFSQAN